MIVMTYIFLSNYVHVDIGFSFLKYPIPTCSIYSSHILINKMSPKQEDSVMNYRAQFTGLTIW